MTRMSKMILGMCMLFAAASLSGCLGAADEAEPSTTTSSIATAIVEAPEMTPGIPPIMEAPVALPADLKVAAIAPEPSTLPEPAHAASTVPVVSPAAEGVLRLPASR